MSKIKIQPNEIRDMSSGEIEATLAEQQAELMREDAEGMTTQSSAKMGKENTGARRTIRRNIARLKTILNERRG